MTSIELIIKEIDDELNLLSNLYGTEIMGRKIGLHFAKRRCEQAKEMHKQEIIDAFDEGQEYEYQYHINNAPKFDSETYYQETFVSMGSDEVELPKHPSVISENGNKLLFDKEGNLIKEVPQQKTLYTEEQVEEAIRIVEPKSLRDYIIQSLKQPKKD